MKRRAFMYYPVVGIPSNKRVAKFGECSQHELSRWVEQVIHSYYYCGWTRACSVGLRNLPKACRASHETIKLVMNPNCTFIVPIGLIIEVQYSLAPVRDLSDVVDSPNYPKDAGNEFSYPSLCLQINSRKRLGLLVDAQRLKPLSGTVLIYFGCAC